MVEVEKNARTYQRSAFMKILKVDFQQLKVNVQLPVREFRLNEVKDDLIGRVTFFRSEEGR